MPLPSAPEMDRMQAMQDLKQELRSYKTRGGDLGNFIRIVRDVHEGKLDPDDIEDTDIFVILQVFSVNGGDIADILEWVASAKKAKAPKKEEPQVVQNIVVEVAQKRAVPPEFDKDRAKALEEAARSSGRSGTLNKGIAGLSTGQNDWLRPVTGLPTKKPLTLGSLQPVALPVKAKPTPFDLMIADLQSDAEIPYPFDELEPTDAGTSDVDSPKETNPFDVFLSSLREELDQVLGEPIPEEAVAPPLSAVIKRRA